MAETHVLGPCHPRQLAEVEAIRAMYAGEGEFHMTDGERAALEILTELEEGASAPNYLSISFGVHLLGTTLGGRHVSAAFAFPRSYPEQEAVRVSVECGGLISKQQHERISLGAQQAANELVGDEAVLQVLQTLQELAWELEESTDSASDRLILDGNCKDADDSPLVLERKVIWFHHIKSTQKRKDILEWGAELKLGGFCKPGFPGVLIFEGESENVAEYVKRIQRLRWQALQVRGQEAEELSRGQDLDSFRRFQLGIKELPESAMSELAANCRQVNLEQLFLSALKISR
ncbi:hypothetical protein MPTK1_8g16390 [Marchantia polymorpha subsp. ruderalis]|uniref:RWD domain-containing protein n=1 Tax=Marchantia polymorpha TaxID=3197 RepID=A0A2R6W4K6_MARPO|nr:hypothetical protein MARPO_0154s0025 [Marchantia polymorpha]BBN20094.1 hypothetical protein Mp_8g16390 [Marchantia polymorpha subsp. ruderalis]|eukprot:PTQ28799.1 hypothetical protein MARPO_0154s0025 [Marchantia polymorpha]